MSQPPYWGQLPGPKVRRMSMSDDYYDKMEHRQSQSQPHPGRPNRASTQTTFTDAPSESTFSPISPISPSFHSASLAPRPSSFQQQQQQHHHPYQQQHLQQQRQTQLPPELVEKRRRRSGQEVPRDVASSNLPAPAPDVPRGAPPLDYKNHYGNGGLHQYQQQLGPLPTSSYGPSTQSSMQANITDLTVEPDFFYAAQAPDYPGQTFDDGDGGNYHLARDNTGSQSMRQPSVGNGGMRSGARPMRSDSTATRRTSTGVVDRTRSNSKTWADDRSPLQRLELTLDSITKEEKRARVEAAEQRARDRAAAVAARAEEEISGIGVDRLKVPEPERSGGASGGGNSGHQVRFRGDDKKRQEPASIFASAALDLQQQQQERKGGSPRDTAPVIASEPANDQQLLPQKENGPGGAGGSKKVDINGLSPRSRIATTINHYVDNSQPQAPPQAQPPAQSQPQAALQAQAQPAPQPQPQPAPQSQPEPEPQSQSQLPPLQPLSPPQSHSQLHYQTQQGSAGPDASAHGPPPQRNLSFRERASKTDAGVDLPQEPPRAPGGRRRGGGDHAMAPLSPLIPTAGPNSGGFSLTRSGSNKLKKNPPGDPWYNVRREAEERGATAAAPSTSSLATSERAHVASHEEPQMTSANVARSRSMGSGGATLKKPPPSTAYRDAVGGPPPPSRAGGFNDYENAGFPHRQQQRDPADTMGLGRSNTMPVGNRPYNQPPTADFGRPAASTVTSVRFAGIPDSPDPDDDEGDGLGGGPRGFRGYLHRGKKSGPVGYQPPQYLDEWLRAPVGSLSGQLLDISNNNSVEESDTADDQSTAWWETTAKKRRASVSKQQQKRVTRAEVPKVENVDSKGPTRFKPPLYLKCGPLLRYCGMRKDATASAAVQTGRNGTGAASAREFWRGSVMIVTQDAESSYETAPTLRLFVQPIELLPPPPVELRGEKLPEEYVDPIAGIPKIGRRGETLYVKPIEQVEEGKDVSMLEPDDGLFEITRTPPNFDPNAPDPPLSFASRTKRRQVDGETTGKFTEVKGFRLNAEQGYTFWRFNIEVELGAEQQRIAYRINRGPATAFWVPAKGQSMNVMFHSCNGFSLSVNPDDLTGPDPMWRDVLNTHQTRPFHVMLGGGDQIYNDAVIRETRLFKDWIHIKNPLHKNHAPFTAELQAELERFYLERYAMWFSRGLFGLANSQVPMVNMYDDHDIIDGFGSYPHHFMKSPVFSGLGNVAFKYYMLFQHQSLPTETEALEPSWCLGAGKGPYINEQSRSLYMSLGGNMALLAVDCRTERTQKEVVSEKTWRALMDRCYVEVKKGETQHLLVLLGVPIAYPRLVWLENILTSRLMEPVKALGRAGILGNFLNNFDGSVEVLDDLDDHWTAKNHKEERRFVVEDLQDLAADKSCRVTVLSGDVHLAAVGQFYSNPRTHQLAKHRDFRYMPNIISSAIANAPPPDLMADVLNRRNKVHHFDDDTDEDMIPLFATGVDGKPRNNKRLLPHRNWCSIREYQPGFTPPATPPPAVRGETVEAFDDNRNGDRDVSPVDDARKGRSVSRGGSILRRLSLSRNRGPSVRPDAPNPAAPADRSRPPLSGGNFMRSFSVLRRRGSTSSQADIRPAAAANGGAPLKLTRTRSLGGGGGPNSSSGSFKNFLFRRGSVDQQQRPPTRRPGDDDAANDGHWARDPVEFTDSEEDIYDVPPLRAQTFPHQPPRGGARPGAAGFRPQQQQYRPGTSAGAAPPMSLRGGAPDPRAVNTEFEVGDDAQFHAAPRHAYTQPITHSSAHQPRPGSSGRNWDRHYDYDDDDLSDDSFVFQKPMPPQRSKTLGPGPSAGVAVVSSEPTIRPFYRTPTGLDAKTLRKRGAAAKGKDAGDFEVDLEGGLDICLNVEVNPRDPAGITAPYRLLVPRLWYEDEEEQLAELQAQAEGGDRAGPAAQAHLGNVGQGDRQSQNLLPPLHQQQQQQHNIILDEFSGSDIESVTAGAAGGGGGGAGGGKRGGSLGGGIKRWFSGRRSKSQYRAHRGGDDGVDDDQAPAEWYDQ